MGARYYNPATCGFLSSDPLGYAATPNLYSYAHGDPVNFFDPHGRFNSKAYTPISSNMSFMSLEDPSLHKTSHVGDLDSSPWFANQSYSYDLGYPEISGIYISMINGIRNSKDDSVLSALNVSSMICHKNIHVVYSAENGMCGDLLEVSFLMMSIATDPVVLLHKQWNDYLTKNPEGTIIQICHSQGTSVVKVALDNFSPESRDRIVVLGISPNLYVYPSLCLKVTHLVSKSDPLAWVDFNGRRECADTIVLLKADEDAPWIDHNLNSPTFKGSLTYYMNEYIKQYRK
jgi:hypothetical protein